MEQLLNLERTRKAKWRYKEKLESLVPFINNQEGDLIWVVPNKKIEQFINERIIDFNWKMEKHKIEVFDNG